jgi:5-methylcytosine-specific restriction endonuclease McrBC GTP-binding regulatory subunit McrB
VLKVTDKTTLKEFEEMFKNIEENKWLDSFIEKKRNIWGNAKKIDFLFGLLLNETLLKIYINRYHSEKRSSTEIEEKSTNTVSANSYAYFKGGKNRSSNKDYFRQEQGLTEESTIKDVSNKIEEILKDKWWKREEMENLINELKEASNDQTVADINVGNENVSSSNKYVQLLKANKQLILHGAPGTGKTYSALNEIAKELGITDNEEIRIDMVQFHPSYDYTDFIDGIRPELSGKELSYILKNGVFKSFCRSAGVIERIMSANRNINKENIEKFLKGQKQEVINFWKEQIESNSGLKEAIDKYNNSDKSIEIVNEVIENLPEFLFIIDEINRAEISKVFGEVMFCIDVDYRGDKGKISTQYSSCATEDTFFIDTKEDKFFIPSNVYIIGTMNNIDRSVEIFDFAMRRRFAWYEVKADEVMAKVLEAMGVDQKLGDNYKDYCEKIKALNEAIVSELNLTRHYHIGPAYFAKINLYMDTPEDYTEALKEVWYNHICQILNEYARNKRGSDDNIKEMYNGFCGIKDKKNQDGKNNAE